MTRTVSVWPAVATAFLLGSCGSTPPPPPPTPEPEPEPVVEEEPETEAEMIARWNERARQGAVVEQLHGEEVRDPYRLLEVDSEFTRAWIDAQTERTTEKLRAWTEEGMRERIDELLSIGVISKPAVGGERVFYLKREGDREQPALYVAEDGSPAEQPLVDPLTHGERAALDWYYPSPTGRYVAFGISHSGDERSTLHVVDVNEGTVLDDRIPRTKWSSVEWLEAEDGFYYTRYPEPDEPGYDEENEDSYFPRVFFHRLGTDPEDDPLVYGGERGTDFPSVTVSDDDRWVVINVFRGWSASDVYLFDRGRAPAERVDAPSEDRGLTTVIAGEESLTVGRVHDDTLYLRTNVDAPKYRIVRVSPQRADRRRAWRDVVEEGDAAIEDWSIIGNRIVVHYMEDVRSKLATFRMNGRPDGEITLPTLGEVEGLDGRPEGDRAVFVFSSYLYPPTLLSWNMSEEELEEIDQVETAMDFEPYELERVRASSADGTEIPITILRRKDMERNGQNPVLLYGYGGFNVSLLPGFTRNALYWLERGGVYAVANLRGGGEFGEDWHQAGNLGNKQKVFEDFEAAIRWFTENDVSNPDRIAITGGSNGGLLMGAMITRVPDAFRATASYVGLYDMVRYHQWPPAELWVSEYGSSEEPEQFAWLLAYSPYHLVQEGVAYPSVLIETADHDSRVYWGHSTKFAAALQEANAGDNPILFYMVSEVGHGAGTRRSDLVERYVRQYAFLLHELGVAADGEGGEAPTTGEETSPGAEPPAAPEPAEQE